MPDARLGERMRDRFTHPVLVRLDVLRLGVGRVGTIGAYERGTLLRQHCAEKLRHAQMRVDKLTFDADGRAGLTPLDPAS